MKTIITSNSKPLRRALCTLLRYIAALWAMPRNALAQLLYVGQLTRTAIESRPAALSGLFTPNRKSAKSEMSVELRMIPMLLDRMASLLRVLSAGALPVGFLPVKTAITPNGATAYVADAGGKSVSVINTATNTVVATVAVGADPVDVSISPDGVHAYVTNAGSNSVSVIETSTNAVSATVPVGFLPVNGAIF
jgi:YVTN family beta-propeller protein